MENAQQGAELSGYATSLVPELTNEQLSGGRAMNTSAIWSWFARRKAVCILSCGIALLLAATLVSASQNGIHKDRGGDSPYTPTKGEWLCLFLNSRRALVNSERSLAGIAVHYMYDRSKPDTLKIQVLYVDGVGEEQVHRCSDRAERHVTEAAGIYGWQDWLQIEHEERKVTDIYTSDPLLR
jgi:hypothetical protein